MSRKKNHYDYLQEHLPSFFEKMGLNWEGVGQGIISAHGDKAWGYQERWERAGIHFHQGVAIYLLSYCYPFDLEVRETEAGWVDPGDWVVQMHAKYGHHLPAPDRQSLCGKMFGPEIRIGGASLGPGIRRCCLLFENHPGDHSMENPELDLNYRQGDLGSGQR